MGSRMRVQTKWRAIEEEEAECSIPRVMRKRMLVEEEEDEGSTSSDSLDCLSLNNAVGNAVVNAVESGAESGDSSCSGDFTSDSTAPDADTASASGTALLLSKVFNKQKLRCHVCQVFLDPAEGDLARTFREHGVFCCAVCQGLREDDYSIEEFCELRFSGLVGLVGCARSDDGPPDVFRSDLFLRYR